MANEIFVGPGGFATIGAAVESAQPLDTIRVAPGIYTGAEFAPCGKYAQSRAPIGGNPGSNKFCAKKPETAVTLWSG